MSTRTYDPALNLLSFAGLNLTGAYAPDTYITAERNEDTFSLQVGASGETVRTKSNNLSGKVTVTLLARSQVNDLLSALAVADENTAAGVAPLFMKELNGTTVLAAESAWIVRQPNTERAKEAGTVEWVFECSNLQMFNGGLL